MRKIAVVLLSVFLVACFSSCNNNSYPGGLPPVIIMPGDGGNTSTTFDVSDYNGLKKAINNADNGDTIHFNDGFKVSTDEETIPISKSLTFTGNIDIVASTSGKTNADISLLDETTGFVLFTVSEGTLNLNALTISIESGVETSVEAVISITGSGAVKISQDTSLPTNTTAISITATAKNANCVTGSIHDGVTIDISSDNVNSSELRENISNLNPSIEVTVDGIEYYTSLVASFLNELNKDAISSYLIANKDEIMEAFGVEEGQSAVDIGTALFDKLQGGDTLTFNLSDGGEMRIYGQFYDPSWDMTIEYDVPESGTAECFPEGSSYTVKNGTVKLHTSSADITPWLDYNICLVLNDYDIDITGVTVSDGENEFELGIEGLTWEDYSNPCVIDPDSSTWEIYIREFYLPASDAECVITADGVDVKWADVHELLEF